MRGDKEWNPIDIHTIGMISPPQWHRLWPTQQLPEVTSPPQGRSYSSKRDRLHNSSSDSDSSTQDNTKKPKLGDNDTTQEEQEQDNTGTKPKEGQLKANGWKHFYEVTKKGTEAPTKNGRAQNLCYTIGK